MGYGSVDATYEGWLAGVGDARAHSVGEMKRCQRLSLALEEALLAAYGS